MPQHDTPHWEPDWSQAPEGWDWLAQDEDGRWYWYRTQPQVGVGAGLRWNSPVGPLQTDLAWGVQAKALRLHLRLGFTF